MPEQTTEQHRPTPEEWKELNRNLAKANAGDTKAVDWLRSFLDQNPQVRQHIGDLARVAEKAWISLIANGDALSAEAIRRQLALIKEDLIGKTPSAVEKLLGDQVVSTLLEVKYMENVAAAGKGSSRTQADLLLKRLESAQRRHTAAIKSLVQIRRLLPGLNSVPGLRVFGGKRESA
jgi:hypothetical protein